MSKCTTGSASICRMQALEFWEYTAIPPSSHLSDFTSINCFDKLADSTAKLVKDKWIYIFSEDGDIQIQEAYVTTRDAPETTALEGYGSTEDDDGDSGFFKKSGDLLFNQDSQKKESFDVFSIFQNNSNEQSKADEKQTIIKGTSNTVQVFQFTPQDSDGSTTLSKSREKSNNKVSQWNVNLNTNSWVLLSSVQLTSERLFMYKYSRPLIQSRTSHFNADTAPIREITKLKCYIADPLEIAAGLKKEYENSQIEVAKFDNDPQNSAGTILYPLVEKLSVENEKIRTKWLDMKAFDARLKPIVNKEYAVRNAAGVAEDQLFAWKTSSFFREGAKDLWGDKERAEEGLSRIPKLTALTETRYLYWEFQQKDSWYEEVMINTAYDFASLFQVGRKITTTALDGKILGFIDQWIVGKIIGEIAFSPLGRRDRASKIETILDTVDDVFIKKQWTHLLPGPLTIDQVLNPDGLGLYDKLLPSNFNPQGVAPRGFVKETGINGVSIRHFFTVKDKPNWVNPYLEVLNIRRSEAKAVNQIKIGQTILHGPVPKIIKDWQRAEELKQYSNAYKKTSDDVDTWISTEQAKRNRVKSWSNITKSIALAVEIVNLTVALKEMFQSDDVKSKINAAGSLCDAIGASDYLLELWLTSAEKHGSMVGRKITKQLVGRILYTAAFIGAITDGVGAYLAAVDAYDHNQYGLVAANAVIIGSAAIGIALAYQAAAGTAVAASAGTAAGSMMFFAGTAGPLGLIAGSMFVLGNIMIWYFSESPLETWCYDSQWGTAYFHSRSSNPKADLTIDLKRLISAIFTPKPSCVIAKYLDPATASTWMDGYGNLHNNAGYYVEIDFELSPYFCESESQLFFELSISLNLLAPVEISSMEIWLKPGDGRMIKRNDICAVWRYTIPFEDLRLKPINVEKGSHLFSIKRLVYDPNGKMSEDELKAETGSKLEDKPLWIRN